MKVSLNYKNHSNFDNYTYLEPKARSEISNEPDKVSFGYHSE